MDPNHTKDNLIWEDPKQAKLLNQQGIKFLENMQDLDLLNYSTLTKMVTY